jgi:hypothetical protein
MSITGIGKYLGEFDETISSSSREYWVFKYVETYGQKDGAHHKAWVLDQIARILNGTPVITTIAKWENYQELRFKTGEPSKEYIQWVKEMRGGWDENIDEFEFDYDEGWPP